MNYSSERRVDIIEMTHFHLDVLFGKKSYPGIHIHMKKSKDTTRQIRNQYTDKVITTN